MQRISCHHLSPVEGHIDKRETMEEEMEGWVEPKRSIESSLDVMLQEDFYILNDMGTHSDFEDKIIILAP